MQHRMIVALDASLWKSFQRACEAQDLTASQVVRAFVRDYVGKNAQQSLPLSKPKAGK